MNAEMIAALRELERERGIAFETILRGLEEGMAAAYKTTWKQEPDGLHIRAFFAQRLQDNSRWPNPVVLKLTNVQPALTPLS